MKFSTLKKSAQHCTSVRGHRMLWEPAAGNVQIGKCAWCGMEACLNTKPMPNEVAIGGEALALQCDHRKVRRIK